MLNANGSGGSAGDPILAGLTLGAIGYADSMNLAAAIAAGIDDLTGYPIVSAVTAGLVPQASQVTPAGIDGYWDSVSGVFSLSGTANLAVGHFLRLNAGVDYVTARVASIVSATEVTFEKPPFGASAANVAYQIAWAYIGTAGQGVFTSSADGLVHWFKFEGETAAGNRGELNPIAFYLRDAPSNLMVFNGGAPTGWRTNDPTPTFDILPTWTNRGGIASVALTESAGITWWDDTVGEKFLYEIVAQGTLSLKLTAGDGAKSCRLIARGRFGSVYTRELGVVSGTLDTAAPDVDGDVTVL